MDRIYDIFEMIEDGPVWRAVVSGHDDAVTRAKELASRSMNEFRVMHLPTNSVVAVLNASQPPSRD